MNRQRRHMRRITAALGALGMALGLVVGQATLAPSPALAEDISDTPLVTWNMEGEDTDQGNSGKWVNASNWMRGNPRPVLALQEVGSGPPEVWGSLEEVQVDAVNTARTFTVRHYLWNIEGTDRQNCTGFANVYFLRTAAAGRPGTGGRTNVAIITDRPADELRIIDNRDVEGRHLLGVRLGNTWYYTFHGVAGLGQGGRDAQGMLQTVQNVTEENRHWVVAGDFNRSPESLTRPEGSTIYRTDLPTHINGNELDYVVASQDVPTASTTRGEHFVSDHWPVAVNTLRAPSQPTVACEPMALESMQAGGLIDVNGARTGNNSTVGTYHRNGQDNQRWRLGVYDDGTVDIRGEDSGRCLDIYRSNRPAAGRRVVIFRCKGSAVSRNRADTSRSQRWRLEGLGNNQFRVRSVLRSDLCLNVAGARDTPDNSRLIVWPCDRDANERFMFAPAVAGGLPRSRDRYGAADSAVGYHSVESMRHGGVFDVRGGRTGNNSAVEMHHRNRQDNQGWYVRERGDHAIQFHGVDSYRCLDIYRSNAPAPGRHVVVFDCKAGDSQWWSVEDVGNNQVRLRSELRPDLCLTVGSGAVADPPDNEKIIVSRCSGSIFAPTNQRFVLTPYDPTGSPVYDPVT
ncbi:RICIN domain-containing protein [Mangrovihabitans endophyticus]|uniref:Ricin B lectin domain-containing protein n=1 Tax=Mangrovihabitans endophyticus TaxID=1751298 RepID=A0A8J3FPD2_9ACTN|nr:RICIN domain-containing protein [Mangrovihabitans endophyticus]GGK98709.1 hypothetical protein GCM10012284_36240 [Mangrovihabitans endophyticus]